MRKILLLCAALVLLAAPAVAVPNDDSTGPEGIGSAGQNHFQIQMEAVQGPGDRRLDPTATRDKVVKDFLLADGWDFGDRAAYRCAWVEWFQGQDEKFEVHFDAVFDYPGFLQINDKYGDELTDPDPIGGYPNLGAFCRATGSADYTDFVKRDGTIEQRLFADGTDHFPHMIHAGDGIQFYQDGQPLVFLPLTEGPCDLLYFVPGDEPGEVWLWWDEDGPTFSHGPDEGDLGCGGGPVEPVAIIRIGVSQADPDIGYCTVSMHEQQCFNVTPPDVTGSGSVALSDGRTATVGLTVPGFFPPAPAEACGTGTITLADGREVEATVCA